MTARAPSERVGAADRITAAAARLREPGRKPVVLASAVAATLAVIYLIAPLTGRDLAAQIARADFARDHPWSPVDFRWFGGVTQFGYSLWSSLALAWVGVRLTGAVCCVVATAQVTALLQRGNARHPAFGGIVAALCQAANLVEGRVTFTLGLVCGLGALLATGTGRGWVPIAALSFLAGAASPVAALLLWVCAGALVVTLRIRQGLLLLVPSAVPVAVIAGLFGTGGNEPFPLHEAVQAVIPTLVVALVLPVRLVAARAGALIGVVMVLTAYLFDTPVGNNATRLSLLFAPPVVAAFIAWRWWLTILAAAATVWPQQASNRYGFSFGASADPAYYEPVAAAIHGRGPLTGRVEVPEMHAHWDAAFLARSVPLARGWLRQLDVALNGSVLFGDHLTTASYRTWLAANSVQYVAVPDAKLTVDGDREREAIRAGLPYLTEVWTNAHWALYAVGDPVPVVRSPGRLTVMSPTTLSFTAPAHATVVVQVRWSRWLSLGSGDKGACIAPSDGNSVELRTNTGGTYRLDSTLTGPAGHC